MTHPSPLGEALRAHQRLADTVRDEHGRVLSVLVRDLRDLSLAEDALADAVTSALERWPSAGVPAQPAGWLLTVARRKALDRLRRADTERRKAPLLVVPDAQEPAEVDDCGIPDERLRLLFTACHPALSQPSQAALTLRVVAGLDTPTIARAFLVSESTMGQRISRAKTKIRDAGIPYAVPPRAEWPARLAGVLSVLYLLFTEGHTVSSGPALQRVDLQEEAIRLARLVTQLAPDEGEAEALLALLLLTSARTPARWRGGRAIPLAEQDRSRWDRRRLAEGTTIVQRRLATGVIGPYGVQAAIAAEHARAATFGETDWRAIIALYDALLATSDSPIVRLNRAVAVLESGDVEGARAAVEALAGPLSEYPHFHASLAEVRVRGGDPQGAAQAWQRAIDLTNNQPLRAHLRTRLAQAADVADLR